MCLCDKCSKMVASILLILGVLFLLQDLAVWHFWNISWYTALILLAALTAFCSTGCPECQALSKKKK